MPDCGDNSCMYRDRTKPSGMRTNGGCVCDECPACGKFYRRWTPGKPQHTVWCPQPEWIPEHHRPTGPAPATDEKGKEETMATETHCTRCRRTTLHRHVHDTAHGISGTHMAGSERYECAACGHPIFAAEGERRGLRFVLDAFSDATKGGTT